QDHDVVTETREDMKVVSSREPALDEWRDLAFAWTVAARVKSNAIVFANGGATVGVGAGQMSRVDSVEIAAKKAGERAAGSVMASDAFFPFRDGIDAAAAAGVRAFEHTLPADASLDQALDVIAQLNADPNVHGAMVQGPMPSGSQIDILELQKAILPEKDVDGLHPENQGLLAMGRPRFVPA